MIKLGSVHVRAKSFRIVSFFLFLAIFAHSFNFAHIDLDVVPCFPLRNVHQD